MNKYKKIILLFVLSMSTFLLFGCNKNIEYTEFQNAYFKISNSDKSFSQSDLESLIGIKANKHEKAKNKEDYNSYIFEINDEELKVFLNKNNKLSFIQYTKIGEVTLVNNLEKNTLVGEYGEGVTSKFKLNSLKEQQKIFDEINN